MNLEQMEQMADDALAQAELDRMREQQEREVEQYLERLGAAKKIKARRRRLGRNGFSTRGMAIPSKRARYATRNSQ